MTFHCEEEGVNVRVYLSYYVKYGILLNAVRIG